VATVRAISLRRLLAVALVSAGMLDCAVVAAGAALDTRTLVLRPSDAPPGFRLDQHASHYVSNSALANGDTQLKKLIATTGRTTGYIARYDAQTSGLTRTILSLSHLLRDAKGADVFLAADDAKQRALNRQRIQRGGHAYARHSLSLGDEAWMYWSTTSRVTLVEWRLRRCVASVMTWGLSRDQTINLARAQARVMRTVMR
jgi:hypothetical protein